VASTATAVTLASAIRRILCVTSPSNDPHGNAMHNRIRHAGRMGVGGEGL